MWIYRDIYKNLSDIKNRLAFIDNKKRLKIRSYKNFRKCCKARQTKHYSSKASFELKKNKNKS